MIFSLQEVSHSTCPNLFYDLLAAGKLVNGQIEVPDEAAARILDGCREVHGLGDVVALVAQPVARAVDAVVGTSLASCGGCKARREALNRHFPL